MTCIIPPLVLYSASSFIIYKNIQRGNLILVTRHQSHGYTSIIKPVQHVKAHAQKGSGKLPPHFLNVLKQFGGQADGWMCWVLLINTMHLINVRLKHLTGSPLWNSTSWLWLTLSGKQSQRTSKWFHIPFKLKKHASATAPVKPVCRLCVSLVPTEQR